MKRHQIAVLYNGPIRFLFMGTKIPGGAPAFIVLIFCCTTCVKITEAVWGDSTSDLPAEVVPELPQKRDGICVNGKAGSKGQKCVGLMLFTV